MLREPRIVISLRVKSITGRETSCIERPTITTRPALATSSQHWRITGGAPTASTTTGGPSPFVHSATIAADVPRAGVDGLLGADVTGQLQPRGEAVDDHHAGAAVEGGQADRGADRTRNR